MMLFAAQLHRHGRFMDSHEEHQLFQRGLEAFNSAHFYDAHEIWEEIWLKSLNPEKIFLQGLIQVAAAFHHYSRVNRLGARRLLRAGLTKIEPFPSVYRGLELEPLRAAVRHWLAALDAGQNPEEDKLPHIKCHDKG
jgi:predicted metal-dependent hydrolase